MAAARCFRAAMSQLTELLVCVRTDCHQSQVELDCICRIELALEELFTNTVRHGYGGDCESPVWLQATHSLAGVCIQYEDAAPAFNPLAYEAQFDQACGDHAPGGLGVNLVRCLANEITYRRQGDRNVLTLTFATRRGSAPM